MRSHSQPKDWIDDLSMYGQEQVEDDDNIPLAPQFPEFDKKHFYGLAGEVAQHAAEDSEADPVAVYASFLDMSAALLGRNKFYQIGHSRHFARLNVALVGASSRSRKGTSEKPVEHILRKSEELYHKRFNNDVLIEERLNIIQGCLSSAEGLIYQVRDASRQKDKEGNPVWEAVEDKRLLVVEEELANTLKVCQREGNTLSPILRKAWDGGDLFPVTKNAQLYSTSPHINTLAHITLYELKLLLSDNDIYNGLANRFLWTCVRRTKLVPFPKPMDSDKTMGFSIQLSAAMKKAEIPGELTMDDDAKNYWTSIYHEISKDKPGIIGSFTSRAEAQVIRLSLLFALIDGLDYVLKKHVVAAVQFVDFCNRSIEYIYSTPMHEQVESDANKLLKELEKGSMTQTEISRFFNGHKTRFELSSMMKELQQFNKVRQVKGEGKKIIWEKI